MKVFRGRGSSRRATASALAVLAVLSGFTVFAVSPGAAAAAHSRAPVATDTYTFHEIHIRHGGVACKQIEANGLNDSGDIVGNLGCGKQTGRGFIRSSTGKVTVLTDPKDKTTPFSAAYIASNGIVATTATTFVPPDTFVYASYLRSRTGHYTALKDPQAGAGGTQVIAVNASRDAVGSYFPGASTKPAKPFVERNGHFHPLTLTIKGATDINPTAINNHEVISGSYDAADDTQHGFVMKVGGKSRTVNAPGAKEGIGRGTVVTDIDNAGDLTADLPGNGKHGASEILRSGTWGTVDFPRSLGTLVVVQGINAAGEITGIYSTGSGAKEKFHAFRGALKSTATATATSASASASTRVATASYSFGRLRLHHAGKQCHDVYAGAINDAGTIVGEAKCGKGPAKAFIRSSTGTLTLLTPPAHDNAGFAASAISSDGTIVAATSRQRSKDAGDFVYHSFLRSAAGAYTAITDPKAGSGGTLAIGVNNRDTVVGVYFVGHGVHQHSEPFVEKSGQYRSLSIQRKHFTSLTPAAVNDRGVIVGDVLHNGNGGRYGFRLHHGTAHLLSAPGARSAKHPNSPDSTDISDIDDSGDISAQLVGASDSTTPVVRRNGHWSTVDVPASWERSTINAIDDSGELVGEYVKPGGLTDVPFVATPK